MRERNLDFDRVRDRRGTGSLKYDFAAKRGKPDDVLPLWVADMDFPTSSFVVDAVTRRLADGIYGYTEPGESYFRAVESWMREHHGWQVQERWMLKTPGVVFALAMAVKAYTKPGDAVLIQQPVYYPFSEVIRDNGRVVVSSDLIYGEESDYEKYSGLIYGKDLNQTAEEHVPGADAGGKSGRRNSEKTKPVRANQVGTGKYHIDFHDFEDKIVRHGVKLFLLCSPHNPVSRVWTREELEMIGEICLRHHVTVVSDEIHEDFVYGCRRHQVFANLREDFREISVTCTSPAKTFNLAGLQVSNIFIPNAHLRAQFRKQIDAAGYSQMNMVGLTACEAAYRDGREWYEQMMLYLLGNISYVRRFLEERLPEVRLIEPEGTYLLWLDFCGLGLSGAELEELITKKAKLWLDSGAMFGPVGEEFERINVACPQSILEEAMRRLECAVRSR
ncbi:MAG: pyridoxal phosphate-dependent aminotransferase [Lachnospiraceae bacterium]|nr:pyridoxal phosphate-dependent aminotransferase [Lachnospiraceae bacterium]